MVKPLVSVLMPLYNNEKYVKEAVQSILKQTFNDFEVIIINDGSTDRSSKIAKAFKDKRIRVIDHKKNLGIVKSLNQGIKTAKGKYIIRMDSDDISRPNRFKRQITYMEAHPETIVCASWIRVFGTEKTYIWKTPTDHNDIMARSLFETPIAHPSVILRREALIKNRLFFDEKYLYAEDYELWTRVGKVGRLATIPQVLLDYRTHPQQTASQKNKLQQKNALKVRIKVLKELGIKPTKSQIVLHNEAANWRLHDTFKMLREWLNIVSKANQLSKRYDNEALNAMLIEKWLGILALHEKSLFKKCVFALSPGKYISLPTMHHVMKKIGVMH